MMNLRQWWRDTMRDSVIIRNGYLQVSYTGIGKTGNCAKDTALGCQIRNWGKLGKTIWKMLKIIFPLRKN